MGRLPEDHELGCLRTWSAWPVPRRRRVNEHLSLGAAEVTVKLATRVRARPKGRCTRKGGIASKTAPPKALRTGGTRCRRQHHLPGRPPPSLDWNSARRLLGPRLVECRLRASLDATPGLDHAGAVGSITTCLHSLAR
jgi:hypothetical protein